MEGPDIIRCDNCGAIYAKTNPNALRIGSPDPDVGSFILGLFIGVLFVAPFIYIPLLRDWFVEQITKATKVGRETAEKWLEGKGAKEEEGIEVK
jgi:hypothetical protein